MLRILLLPIVISLAACAPMAPTPAPRSGLPSQSTLGSTSSFSGSQPEAHFDSNAPVDNPQSTALTNYLHGSQLPLVGARVLAANGGPRQAILYGYVATPFGKADAVDKTRRWLNDSGAQIDNRIKIEPSLAGPSAGPDSTTADNLDTTNPDIQRYEAEQNRQQAMQQQQYMNQGAGFGPGAGMGMGFGTGGGGLSMFLPLLLGGGSAFGLGGGGVGMGSPSPYGSPYASPYGTTPYGTSAYPSNPPPGSFIGP